MCMYYFAHICRKGLDDSILIIRGKSNFYDFFVLTFRSPWKQCHMICLYTCTVVKKLVIYVYFMYSFVVDISRNSCRYWDWALWLDSVDSDQAGLDPVWSGSPLFSFLQQIFDVSADVYVNKIWVLCFLPGLKSPGLFYKEKNRFSRQLSVCYNKYFIFMQAFS